MTFLFLRIAHAKMTLDTRDPIRLRPAKPFSSFSSFFFYSSFFHQVQRRRSAFISHYTDERLFALSCEADLTSSSSLHAHTHTHTDLPVRSAIIREEALRRFLRMSSCAMRSHTTIFYVVCRCHQKSDRSKRVSSSGAYLFRRRFQ